MSIVVRPATPEDAAAIAQIYNQGIEDRLATLEMEPRTAEDRRAWLTGRGPRHPVLAAEQDGEVVAWASLNVFNPRAAYDDVADFSVYVVRTHRRRGIGRRLLERLVALAGELGYHKLVLATLAHNAAGAQLYEKVGFRQVGIYREHGRLDGRWVDVLIMEKLLESS